MKFEISLKLENFKRISINSKQIWEHIMNFNKVCESIEQFKYTVFKWGQWLCFEKNLLKFKQIMKILLKIL